MNYICNSFFKQKMQNIKLTKNNESFGMTVEYVMCMLNNQFPIDINRCERYLINEIQKLTIKMNLPPLLYVGNDKACKADFKTHEGITYSVKTNINNDKVSPQNIGQCTRNTFIKKVFNKYNLDNDKNDITDYKLKEFIVKYSNILLNDYLDNLMCCNYLLYYLYNYDSLSCVMLSKDDLKIDFKNYKITFTKTLDNWNESNTVKVNNKSIGEFQIHKNRDCIKFRFNMSKLLSICNIKPIKHVVVLRSAHTKKHYLINGNIFKIESNGTIGELVGEYYQEDNKVSYMIFNNNFYNITKL